MSSSDNLLASRYAKAFFELAVESKVQEKVAADLRNLVGCVASSESLSRAISNPTIARPALVKVMEEVLKKIKVQKLTTQAISLLASNRRLALLESVACRFEALLMAQKGELSAEVITAKPLTKAKLATVEKQLTKSLGQTVKVTPKDDPSILGGIVIKIGSRMLDASLSTKINQIELMSKQTIASM